MNPTINIHNTHIKLKNEDFFCTKKKIRINQDSKFEKTKIENGCFYL